MASPERPILDTHSSSTEYEQSVTLAEIDRQLEATDENENLLERTYKREQLLELRDEIEAASDKYPG